MNCKISIESNLAKDLGLGLIKVELVVQVNGTQLGFALCIIYTSLVGLVSKQRGLSLSQALPALIQRSHLRNKKKEKSCIDLLSSKFQEPAHC